MKEINGEIVRSIEFDYKTMYSQFNFTYGSGLEGHCELMLEGNNDWHVQLPEQHEPEDVEQLLNELTDKAVTIAFPGWKYHDLTYKHKPGIGWIVHADVDPIKLSNALVFGDK